MKKFNYYIGVSISAWLLVALIIVAELLEPFKALLAATFSHHWIGKAVLIALAFIVFGFLIKEKKSHESLAWKSALGSLATIFLFFVVEFLV